MSDQFHPTTTPTNHSPPPTDADGRADGDDVDAEAWAIDSTSSDVHRELAAVREATEYPVSIEDARTIIEFCIEYNWVIEVQRIGAVVWLSQLPYRNNSGVKISQWQGVSYTFETRPDRTLLTMPTILGPDDFANVNVLTDERVVAFIANNKRVDVRPHSESPFGRDVMGPYIDPDE